MSEIPGINGPAARRERVRRLVLESGYVALDDLVNAFDVSVMTMHRDLDALEADGWLVKIRGGATANPAALLDAGVRERSSAMLAEKHAIARVAAGLVSTGHTLFLDDSTTVLAMADHLSGFSALTVATNFLPAATRLAEGGGEHDVHVLGGQLHARQEACLGRQTVEAVGRFRADIAFMSTTALSGHRCLHRSEATVLVRQAFLDAADRSVLLIDHAKFGRPAPHVLCDVSRFDTIITDEGASADDLGVLRDRCADVRVAFLG